MFETHWMKSRQEARHRTPPRPWVPRPGLPCLRSAASVAQPPAAFLLPGSSLLLRPLCFGSILPPRPGSPGRRFRRLLRRGLSSTCLCWNPGGMPSTASRGAQAVPAARGSDPSLSLWPLAWGAWATVGAGRRVGEPRWGSLGEARETARTASGIRSQKLKATHDG